MNLAARAAYFILLYIMLYVAQTSGVNFSGISVRKIVQVNTGILFMAFKPSKGLHMFRGMLCTSGKLINV